MTSPLPMAVVGGGPAGAFAASLLAQGGSEVLLFDEKLAWEKPCGGGLTYKALQQYPFLAEAEDRYNSVEQCELMSPSGKRARFRLRFPVAIFPRCTLNAMLLERARAAGADLRRERVTRIAGTPGDWRLVTPHREYRARYLVLAAGARNPFLGQFTVPFSAKDLMATAGYFIPGRSQLMRIQFLADVSGYIWVFPRPDHASAGICGKMDGKSTAELRHLLEEWLKRNGFALQGARFYSHILPALDVPALDSLRVCGEGWALVGDSAGLVDPITGEGLYYALRSAELCAQALLHDDAALYQRNLENEIFPELRLAARVCRRFYTGQVFGESVLERMVALTSQSESFRRLMSDLFAGIQGYRDLRSRLYGILPSLTAEALALALRLPWSGSTEPADLVAE